MYFSVLIDHCLIQAFPKLTQHRTSTPCSTAVLANVLIRYSTSIMASLLFQTRTVTSSWNLECLHRPLHKFCPHITRTYPNFHPCKHRSCLAQNYRIHHTHWHWRHLLARNFLKVSGVFRFSMFQLQRSMLIHQTHASVSDTRQLSEPVPFGPITDCSFVYIHNLPHVCCMTQPTSSFISSA